MAESQDSTGKTEQPKSICFLGCFGSYGKVSEKNPFPETVKSGIPENTRWFSWSRFRMTKSTVKTVPVDATLSGKDNRGREIMVLRSVKKVSSKRHTSVNGIMPCEIPAVLPDLIVPEKPQKVCTML